MPPPRFLAVEGKWPVDYNGVSTKGFVNQIRSGSVKGSVMPNIRLALRALFKSPFVTLVAILSLALGIGANSAIFSLFDQMLLRPLPVPRPNELVNLKAPGP